MLSVALHQRLQLTTQSKIEIRIVPSRSSIVQVVRIRKTVNDLDTGNDYVYVLIILSYKGGLPVCVM